MRLSKDPLKSELRVDEAVVNVLSTRIATRGYLKPAYWIQLWDALSGTLIWQREEDVQRIFFSEGGKYLVLLHKFRDVELIDGTFERTFDTIKISYGYHSEPLSFTENGIRLGIVVCKEPGVWTMFREGGSFVGVLRPPEYDNSQVAKDVAEIWPSTDSRAMFYSGNGSRVFVVSGTTFLKIMGWDVRSRQVIRRVIYHADTPHFPKPVVTHSDDYVTIRTPGDVVGSTMVFSLNSDQQNPTENFRRVSFGVAVPQGVVYLSNGKICIWSSEHTSIGMNLGKSMVEKGEMLASAINDEHRSLTLVFKDGKFEFFEK
jgi:hypothetical protein